MSQRLMPGNYFIEMAFKRPVTEETLSRALMQMGFTDIEFDKNGNQPRPKGRSFQQSA